MSGMNTIIGIRNGLILSAFCWLLIGLSIGSGGCKTLVKPDTLPNVQPTPLPEFTDAINAEDVLWLGENVGAWPVKYALSVSLKGDKIIYDQEGTSNWTPKQTGGGANLVGNPWIIAKINGQWVAGNHEWMRIGQKIKGKASVAGDHIKVPRYFPMDWTPTAGEEYGFVVTGLSRCPVRNEIERTQIVMLTWE